MPDDSYFPRLGVGGLFIHGFQCCHGVWPDCAIEDENDMTAESGTALLGGFAILALVIDSIILC